MDFSLDKLMTRGKGGTAMRRRVGWFGVCVIGFFTAAPIGLDCASGADLLRDLQQLAEEQKRADWGHWGKDKTQYSTWTSHSNRLIPVYTFGMGLEKYQNENSVYRDPQKIKALYGYVPKGVVNSRAMYMDQTDVYRLQQDAVAQGKKHVILIVFDGMDWQITHAAAIYKSGKVYTSGRGSGLLFQDYDRAPTDYGWFVSSPHNTGTNVDPNAQTVLNAEGEQRGGYDASIGGMTPWARPQTDIYLLGQLRRASHAVTDSAASATSMTAGVKTYNAAINFDHQGQQVVPIARELQANGFRVGVVTSVPISHATPAAAYSNNVTRNDYQDLSRDLVGLPSVAHRQTPLPGVDVLLGAGWGEESDSDDKQGQNYIAGNRYLPQPEIDSIDHRNGGKYVVAQRTPGESGEEVLIKAARQAREADLRLFGFFGVGGGQLPFQTADGGYNPYGTEYSEAEVSENPTLADMTRAALGVLSKNAQPFWLMIEAGDVDWANHSNNLDNSVGAVISGDEAFYLVTRWVERQSNWDETVVILTADHGHYFVLDDPQALVRQPADLAKAP
jgi:alkaline phosphatase